jgi:hypothetical protein
MLGYTYKDIQEMGGTLDKAIGSCDPALVPGLLKVWDFFDGLLAEGYIDENTFYGELVND